MMGKQFSDEPSGNVAVQSASTPPSGVDRQLEPESERDQTTDLRPGRPAAPPAPPVVSTPPVAFGRYRVKNILGGGGFGVVYLGHDEQLDRPVAIKVYRGGPTRPRLRPSNSSRRRAGSPSSATPASWLFTTSAYTMARCISFRIISKAPISPTG